MQQIDWYFDFISPFSYLRGDPFFQSDTFKQAHNLPEGQQRHHNK